MPTSAEYLTSLHRNIDQYFSFSEVRTLCFELGIDYENIEGEIRTEFIRNLLISLAKQKRLQELVNKVKLERPFLNIQPVPHDFELPASIAQADTKTVINHIHGDQYNIGSNANIGQIGDRINTGGGDFVEGDKTVQGDEVRGDKVSGDNISVGDVRGGQGIAIGGDASASYEQNTIEPHTDKSSQSSSAYSGTLSDAVQQAAQKVKAYSSIAEATQPRLGHLLKDSVHIILSIVQEKTSESNHLTLLFVAQQEIARQLADSVPGIEQVVGDFETAVSQQRP